MLWILEEVYHTGILLNRRHWSILKGIDTPTHSQLVDLIIVFNVKWRPSFLKLLRWLWPLHAFSPRPGIVLRTVSGITTKRNNAHGVCLFSRNGLVCADFTFTTNNLFESLLLFTLLFCFLTSSSLVPSFTMLAVVSLSWNTFLSSNRLYCASAPLFFSCIWADCFFLWQFAEMFYSWKPQGTLTGSFSWKLKTFFTDKDNLHYTKVVEIFCESFKNVLLKHTWHTDCELTKFEWMSTAFKQKHLQAGRQPTTISRTTVFETFDQKRIILVAYLKYLFIWILISPFWRVTCK